VPFGVAGGVGVVVPVGAVVGGVVGGAVVVGGVVVSGVVGPPAFCASARCGIHRAIAPAAPHATISTRMDFIGIVFSFLY
jgi:hypothetical protein